MKLFKKDQLSYSEQLVIIHNYEEIKAENKEDLKIISFLMFVMIFFCTCCLLPIIAAMVIPTIILIILIVGTILSGTIISGITVAMYRRGSKLLMIKRVKNRFEKSISMM